MTSDQLAGEIMDVLPRRHRPARPGLEPAGVLDEVVQAWAGGQP
ncbi:hypothetical protein [Nonomuraea guangzhouensis]|uniref:Uncharacterized protein n=1 Tax=Nonomuraea guangzhouensis TaxID=1291555 RepID=A0ABW4GUA2_9ACTN|nr:hypothetical protein [Nonomuraea guangzhouensis]